MNLFDREWERLKEKYEKRDTNPVTFILEATGENCLMRLKQISPAFREPRESRWEERYLWLRENLWAGGTETFLPETSEPIEKRRYAALVVRQLDPNMTLLRLYHELGHVESEIANKHQELAFRSITKEEQDKYLNTKEFPAFMAEITEPLELRARYSDLPTEVNTLLKTSHNEIMSRADIRPAYRYAKQEVMKTATWQKLSRIVESLP